MAAFAITAPLVLAAGLFGLSVVLTWLMIRANILYLPNDRSSHSSPIPNGGGVAITATFLIGYVAVYFAFDDTRLAERHMIGFALAALGISTVSFLDDLGRIGSFAVKLVAQVAAAAVLVAFGVVFRRLSIPFFGDIDLGLWGYLLTVLWVVALTNIFNFMDGLDGLAGGTAVIVAFFLGVIALVEGSRIVYVLCCVLLAASFGFLVFNFPRGRIFMGDVGSQFLGFIFAALAVIAAEYDAARISVLVVPLLFLNFIFDTVFTVVRRSFAGDDITTAHCKHLYQVLHQAGFSHVQVSLLHYAMSILQGLGALWLTRLGPDRRGWVILPFLALQSGYAGLLLRSARRRRIAGV